MTRAAAITRATAVAQKLWAGTVVVQPDAKTGAHHHGELETILYIVKGRARFRWGEHLEFVDEAGPGDFIYVPPFVPHQEINARTDEPVEAVVVRSGRGRSRCNLTLKVRTLDRRPAIRSIRVPRCDPARPQEVSADLSPAITSVSSFCGEVK